MLLDNFERIEINARDNDGRTAFKITCMDRHEDVVKLLLDSPERIEMNKKYCINMGLPTWTQ